MATVTLIPTYPIPNRPTQLVFNAQQSGCNFVRVWVTVAPTDSTFDKSIKSTLDPRNRVEVFSDTPGSDFPLNTIFDKGGKYTFIIQEYKKGSGYGGGYQGDPDGSDLEVSLGSEYTVFVYVGQRMTQVIGPPQLRATINVWVWDSNIRATHKSIHGEDTPSITATPLTDTVKLAIESDSVKSALLNLVDKHVDSVVGDLETMVDLYWTKWNTHVQNSHYHLDADTFNKLDSSLATAFTPNTLKDFVNKAISYQRLHFTNDNSWDIDTARAGITVGPGLGEFHTKTDRPNITLYSSVGNFDEAYGALVDLIRCYEHHRNWPGVHDNNDNTNKITGLSYLMKVHDAYLEVIASSDSTPPAAQSTGAQLLISGAGFKES